MSTPTRSAHARSGPTDAPSVLSTSTKNNLKKTLGGDCFVCGSVSIVEVAHIVPHKAFVNNSQTQVHQLRGWAPSLANYQANQPENLMLLCPNHHADYDDGQIALVPTESTRRAMVKKELNDFRERRRIVRSGGVDPGRTLLFPPEIEVGFEYIPINIKFLVQNFNTTATRQGFAFDTRDLHRPHPGGLNNVFPYALLVMAQQPLNSGIRLENVRTNRARTDVLQLIRLYARTLQAPVMPSEATVAAVNILQQADTYFPPTGPLPPVPEAPPDASPDGEAASDDGMMEDHGLGSSIQTPSDGSDDDSRDKQLARLARLARTAEEDMLEYEDEPATTPAVLSGRLHLPVQKFDPDGVSCLRFATSSDFVTDPALDKFN